MLRRKQLFRVDQSMRHDKEFVIITIHLDPTTAKKLSAFCKQEGINRTKYVGEFLEVNIDYLISDYIDKITSEEEEI